MPCVSNPQCDFPVQSLSFSSEVILIITTSPTALKLMKLLLKNGNNDMLLSQGRRGEIPRLPQGHRGRIYSTSKGSRSWKCRNGKIISRSPKASPRNASPQNKDVGVASIPTNIYLPTTVTILTESFNRRMEHWQIIN